MKKENLEGLSKEEALELLIDDIDEKATIRAKEDGAYYEVDYNSDLEEGYFFAEVKYRIEHKGPGWEILEEEYGDNI